MGNKTCQFAGDANTVAGRLIPCREPQWAVMRLRGIEQIVLGYKPRVCQQHMTLMLSAAVRAKGRDWLVDHFVSEEQRWHRA